MTSTALGVAAAFAAAVFYNLAIVVQKYEAQRSTAEGVRILVALARRPIWLLGIAIQMVGFACHTFALTQAPVSVVQPIIAAGVVFVVLFSALILEEQPGRRELTGILMTVVGLIVLVATVGEAAEMAEVSVATLLLTVGVLWALVLSLIGFVRGRGERGTAAAGVMAGLAAGLAFGASDSMNRLMGAWLSPGEGWQPSAAMGIAAAILLFLYGFVGFVTVQNALRSYRANTVQPSVNPMNMLVPIVVATLVYGQPIPSSATALAARFIGIVLVLLGVFVLSTSQQVAETYVETEASET